MRIRHVHAEVWLPRPLAEVFPFFADARHLGVITPPWLRFEILTPMPVEMKVGCLIDCRIRLRGVPLRWRSEIIVWEPPTCFVDQQRRGPFRRWSHEHRFAEHAGRTQVTDHVRYAVWGGSLVDTLFVCSDLARIFAFRRDKMLEFFGGGEGPDRASHGP